MPVFAFFTVTVIFLSGLSAEAREAIYNTKNQTWLSVEELAAQVGAGTLVVFGEEHVTPDNEKDPVSIRHHENQARWLEALRTSAAARGSRLRLGLEFLTYPDQPYVDDYLAGRLSQTDFLKQVKWGANPFEAYDRLMQISILPSGLGTRALNIPKEISSKVAKVGPEGLSEKDLALLPPIWERGGPEYFERFASTMRGHVPEEKIERYFWAQSLWDDTMAWNATKNREADEIVNVIVGEFHVEFGHGLPARIRRYGASQVVTVLQHFVPKNESWPERIEPDPQFGHRADYIYVFSLD